MEAYERRVLRALCERRAEACMGVTMMPGNVLALLDALDAAEARVAVLETALRDLAESHRSCEVHGPRWCLRCGVTWGTEHVLTCRVGGALRVLEGSER